MLGPDYFNLQPHTFQMALITYAIKVSINLHSQENGKKLKFLHFIKMGHMMMLIIIIPYRFYLYYQKSFRNMCMIVYHAVYLNKNYLLHLTQSWFRSQHSCKTALVHMIDSWLNAMDNGELEGIVHVDF